MQGYQRNLSLYKSLNTQVLGVSRDDVTTLKYWTDHIHITFTLLSNISGYLGEYFGVVDRSKYGFARRTVIIDKEGIIRYVKDGSPDYEEIINFLKKMNKEEERI